MKKKQHMWPPTEYSVRGAMAFTLRVSRVWAIAPLHFQKRHGAWIVSNSHAAKIYSYILVTIISLTIMVAVILDCQTDVDRQIRLGSLLKQVVWFADATIITLISSVAVYAGPTRIKHMMECWTQIDKINSCIKYKKMYKVQSSKFKVAEKKKYIIVLLTILGAFILNLCDYITFIAEAIYFDKELKVACLYGSYYINYFMSILLEMQFILTAMSLHSSLKAINDSLNNLVSTVENKQDQKEMTIPSTNCYLSPGIRIRPSKSINNIIDSIPSLGSVIYEDAMTRKPQSIHKVLRNLAFLHGSLCDIVRCVDKCNGAVLLLILMSILLHLVVTPYYLILSLTGDPALLQVRTICMQFGWSIFHFSKTLALVEPCQWTQDEMQRTHEVVSQLMRHTPPSQKLFMKELNQFYRQLILYKNTYYAPMGVMILKRSLLATIIGGVTTYLIVVIQLQKQYQQTSTANSTK